MEVSLPFLTGMQIYNQYRDLPKYKGKAPSTIAQMLLKDNLLTPSQYRQLLNSPMFTLIPPKTAPKDGYENFGLNLSTKQNYVDRGEMLSIEAPKKYHRRFPLLELDSKNNIDMAQFDLDSLKRRYPSDKYNVQSEITDNGTVLYNVTVKKTGKLIFSIDASKKDIDSISVYMDNGNDKRTMVYIYRGKIEKYNVNEVVDNRFESSFYDAQGKLVSKNIRELDNSKKSYRISYINGKPYKKIYVDKKIPEENYLVKDLIDDIYAKSKLGLPTTRESLKGNILTRITKDNISEVMAEYEKQTGQDLIEAVKNEIGIKASQPALYLKLINHIETLYFKYGDARLSGEKLAERLYDTINAGNEKETSKYVKMLTPKNIKYVISAYKGDSYKHRDESVLLTTVGVLLDYNKVYDELAEWISPYTGLLEAIEKSNIKADVKKDYIKKIIDVALKDLHPAVVERTQKDISTHPADSHKIEVDILAARNTNPNDTDFKNFALLNFYKKKIQERVKNNSEGIGDIVVKQGYTGDCWLLSGLISIMSRPQLRTMLEKLVLYDEKTKTYTVNLLQYNKKYEITENDIKSNPYLSSGSNKINALEVAIDKFIRELAYKNKDRLFPIDEEFGYADYITIDSGHESFLYYALFGANKSKSVTPPNPLTTDFNNQSVLYNISFGGKERIEIPDVAVCKDNPKLSTLHTRHAYSIIGSDKENVYIVNPWDSSAIITIKRTDLAKIKTRITGYIV